MANQKRTWSASTPGLSLTASVSRQDYIPLEEELTVRIHGIQDNDELSDDTAKVRQAADTRQHELRTGATSSEPHYWPGQEPQVPPCVMASLGLLHLSLTPWHIHCHSPEWSSHYSLSAECSRVSRQNSPGQKQMFTSSFPHPDTRSTAAAAITWEPCRMFQHCPHSPC